MVRTASVPTFSLHTSGGRQKCLTTAERARFMTAAAACPPTVETLCLALAWTGARITEVLNITHRDLDVEAGTVSVHCLKKRRTSIVREVPVPTPY